tara:strand:+ start:121 stop:396 length:276 start_codon:yes stop_codon:yes gene_type:complete
MNELQSEIKRQVEEKMTESQRRYFLTEQLKSIKKELGLEKDDKDSLVTQFQSKVNDLKTLIETDPKAINSETLKTIESELNKLNGLEVSEP